MMFRKKSLLKSIRYSSVGVLLGVILVICAVFVTTVSPGIFETKKSEVYYRVAAQSAEMDAWLTEHMIIAENLALTAVVNDLHGPELKTYLHDCVLSVSPSIMDCYAFWASESPYMACAVFVPADDYVPETRGWYKAALAANGTAITDPYIDAFTGKIVITISSLLKNDRGQIVGCCGLDIDLTDLVRRTAAVHADEQGYGILVDAAGNVVADSRHAEYSHRLEGKKEVMTALSDISPVYKQVMAAPDYQIVEGKDIDGIDSFFPMVEVGETGWKLLYVADRQEARADVNAYTFRIIAIGLAGILFGSVFFWIKFTRRLRPLGDIDTIVIEMSRGKLRHEYPKHTVNDEIGTICTELRQSNEALRSYVSDISDNLSRMAQGDFQIQFNADYVGDFSPIKISLEKISSAMIALIRGISAASGRVNESAGSVSGSSSLLASGAQEQSATVDALSETLDLLIRQIAANSAAAGQADDDAKKTAQTIVEGNSQLEELVQAMDQITKLSDEIEQIVMTIDDIAFQTNLLALNASVEAARAGAAGKGFAVVADEVRDLAQKSAEAAKSTAQLIKRTTSAIATSSKLAHSAVGSLGGVVQDAADVSRLVGTINQTSMLQIEEVSRIRENLTDLEDIATRNAGTAQQSAAASDMLNRQAQTLEGFLQKYKKDAKTKAEAAQSGQSKKPRRQRQSEQPEQLEQPEPLGQQEGLEQPVQTEPQQPQ